MGRALQIIPPGARQVAPGVWQQRAPRRHGGHGKHKKHGHGPKRKVSMLAQRQIKYAAVLQFADALQAQQRIQVPNFISFRALVLYIWGQNKHDKGAISTAKTMQYDKMAGNWGIGSMMQMAMGQAMSGGMFGGGGAFGGGAPIGGPRGISAPDNSSGTNSQQVADATALIDSLSNAGVV